MGLRGPAAVALWMPVRGEDLWRNCEGIGRPSGLRGASSADLKKKQSNSIDVGLASPRDKPRTSREPLSGRRQGAPIPSASGKSENRKKGKRLPGPESLQRDKRILDGWGGAPRGAPEASMRGIRLTPAAEPGRILASGEGGAA